MSNFEKPPKIDNYEGKTRNLGFEIEFANIDLEKILEILQKEFFFEVNKVNNYFYKLSSKYGDFILELDFELLTKQKIKASAKDLSKFIGIKIPDKDAEYIENYIAKLSKDIVPFEISTPPLAFDKIDIVEEIIEKLSQNHAKGTSHKLYYAFGLHINIEVISLEVESLLSYLRAYVILQEFLNKDAKLDIARKISPFIDNFPKDYIEYILNENYKPSKREFIEDYIKFNPTRNRSLDMLPILAFLDEKLVREYLPDEKIKPRPAFHYRLSNSQIGERNWRVSNEWNRWVVVENLANDKNSLEKLSKEYINYIQNLINMENWDERISKWLQNH